MVRDENGRQENGEQTGYAQQNALEQGEVPGTFFKSPGLPKKQSRKIAGAELSDKGHGGPGRQFHFEDIDTVIVHAFRQEADGGRDAGNVPGIQFRPEYAGTDQAVAIGCYPPFDTLIRGVAEGKNNPVWVCAVVQCVHFHAPGNAVSTGSGFHLQAVSPAFIEFAEMGDLYFFLIWNNFYGFEGVGRGG